ncbi:16580_t:CDS:2, partial [Gigaspora rosea]
LAHSFIIDPDDETYHQNNVFTLEELEKIRDTESKDLPKMLTELLKFISSFRMKTTENLRISYSRIGRNHMKSTWKKRDLILRKGIYEYGRHVSRFGQLYKVEKNKLRQLELVSFIHASSLFIILLRIDAPAGYMYRITRSETLQIPTDVRYFEEALKCMAIVRKTIDVIEGINNDDDHDDILENLQEASIRIVLLFLIVLGHHKKNGQSR